MLMKTNGHNMSEGRDPVMLMKTVGLLLLPRDVNDNKGS